MIPDFIKRENRKKPDLLQMRFRDAIKRYEEHFPDDGLITEASSMNMEEWIQLIDNCIKEDKTVWELLDEEYDPDCYY